MTERQHLKLEGLRPDGLGGNDKSSEATIGADVAKNTNQGVFQVSLANGQPSLA